MTRVLLLLLVVAMPVGAALFRVWVHQDIVLLGYRISDAEKRRAEAAALVKKLEVELAAERSPDRLAAMSRQLGMRPPQPEQLVREDGRP